MATIEAWMAWEALRDAKHATEDGLKALGDALLSGGDAALAAGAYGVAGSLFDAAKSTYETANALRDADDPEPPESLEPSDPLVPTGEDDDVGVATAPSGGGGTGTSGGGGGSGSDPQPGSPPDNPEPPGGEAGVPADDGGGDRDQPGRVGGRLGDPATFFAGAFGLLGAVSGDRPSVPTGGVGPPARPPDGITDPNPEVSAAAARRLAQRAAVAARSVGFTDPRPDLVDADHALLRDAAARLASQQAQVTRAIRALGAARGTQMRNR